MHKSKLEAYEAILGALVKRPQRIDRLGYMINLDCVALRRHLDFLMENGLVEERFLRNGKLYGATERGVSVFKTLDFQKYFKKIQDTLVAIDEAMRAIPQVSKLKEESEHGFEDEKY